MATLGDYSLGIQRKYLKTRKNELKRMEKLVGLCLGTQKEDFN